MYSVISFVITHVEMSKSRVQEGNWAGDVSVIGW